MSVYAESINSKEQQQRELSLLAAAIRASVSNSGGAAAAWGAARATGVASSSFTNEEGSTSIGQSIRCGGDSIGIGDGCSGANEEGAAIVMAAYKDLARRLGVYFDIVPFNNNTNNNDTNSSGGGGEEEGGAESCGDAQTIIRPPPPLVAPPSASASASPFFPVRLVMFGSIVSMGFWDGAGDMDVALVDAATGGIPRLRPASTATAHRKSVAPSTSRGADTPLRAAPSSSTLSAAAASGQTTAESVEPPTIREDDVSDANDEIFDIRSIIDEGDRPYFGKTEELDCILITRAALLAAPSLAAAPPPTQVVCADAGCAAPSTSSPFISTSAFPPSLAAEAEEAFAKYVFTRAALDVVPGARVPIVKFAKGGGGGGDEDSGEGLGSPAQTGEAAAADGDGGDEGSSAFPSAEPTASFSGVLPTGSADPSSTGGFSYLDFDLTTRLLGARNSWLLRRYMAQSQHARVGALFVKQWSKACGINQSSKGLLSSYGVTILWVFFLLRSGRLAWVDPQSVSISTVPDTPLPFLPLLPPSSNKGGGRACVEESRSGGAGGDDHELIFYKEVAQMVAEFFSFYADAAGEEKNAIATDATAGGEGAADACSKTAASNEEKNDEEDALGKGCATTEGGQDRFFFAQHVVTLGSKKALVTKQSLYTADIARLRALEKGGQEGEGEREGKGQDSKVDATVAAAAASPVAAANNAEPAEAGKGGTAATDITVVTPSPSSSSPSPPPQPPLPLPHGLVSWPSFLLCIEDPYEMPPRNLGSGKKNALPICSYITEQFGKAQKGLAAWAATAAAAASEVGEAASSSPSKYACAEEGEEGRGRRKEEAPFAICASHLARDDPSAFLGHWCKSVFNIEDYAHLLKDEKKRKKGKKGPAPWEDADGRPLPEEALPLCTRLHCLSVKCVGKRHRDCEKGLFCHLSICRLKHPTGWDAARCCHAGLRCADTECALLHPEGWDPYGNHLDCPKGLSCGDHWCYRKRRHPPGHDFRVNIDCKYGVNCADYNCTYRHNIDPASIPEPPPYPYTHRDRRDRSAGAFLPEGEGEAEAGEGGDEEGEEGGGGGKNAPAGGFSCGTATANAAPANSERSTAVRPAVTCPTSLLCPLTGRFLGEVEHKRGRAERRQEKKDRRQQRLLAKSHEGGGGEDKDGAEGECECRREGGEGGINHPDVGASGEKDPTQEEG